MKRALVGLAALLAQGLLDQPAHAEPLRLESFFNGRFEGQGTVDNKREGTRRTFTATMLATWEGPHGALLEDLAYADGEKKHIVWHFDRTGPDRYVGHRDDLVGDATIETDGEAIRMRYTARTRLPSGQTWTLSFDDRLEQIAPGTVTMTGEVSYLFIGVGTTHMTIRTVGR